MICVRFVTSDDFISKSIREITWGPFSHVEFVTEDGLHALGAMHNGGVQLRPINHDVVTLDYRFLLPANDTQTAAIWTYAKAQIGKPYDTKAIAGILVHRDWREEDSWFCAELVSAACEQGGYPIVHAPGNFFNRIVPNYCFLNTTMTLLSSVGDINKYL